MPCIGAKLLSECCCTQSRSPGEYVHMLAEKLILSDAINQPRRVPDN